MKPTGLRTAARLPPEFFAAVKRQGVRLTRDVLAVQVRSQRMSHYRRIRIGRAPDWGPAAWPRRPDPATCVPKYRLDRDYVISTSRFGIGQDAGSNRTPLGLHRIAEKIGTGWPVGAVFESRRLTGFTWQGRPGAPIAHRILWLEGLEAGLNRGPGVDSHDRYIYIHGVGDESTLGSPASCGCIHLAARDLIPLADTLPPGSLVWIVPG